MKETHLQHKIIMWFSQTYPHLNGLLFEINNDTYNAKHAMSRRAMGMVKGASDLGLVYNTFAGIEIKAPGSIHKTDHIKNQIEWGKSIIAAGGHYIISSDIEEIKLFIEGVITKNNIVTKLQNESFQRVEFSKKTITF